MSFIHDTRSVEQQRFFSGQRLFDSDLQGIEAFNREMRWLHNQSLHQPGIGNGFAVTGGKGEREVTVGPGYAIDDLGREIVLTSSRTLPVPPVAGDLDGTPKRYLLTVEYPEDVDLEIVEQRQGLCADPGATRQRVEPIFCWVPLTPDGAPEDGDTANDILRGRQLVLAEVAVRDCKLFRDRSVVERRNARPTARPYIACGEADPVDWRIWKLPEQDERFDGRECCEFVFGLEADIDTTSAGFLTTPSYSARLNGDRLFPYDGALRVRDGEGNSAVILDGMLHIVDPSPKNETGAENIPTATQFTVRLLVLFFGLHRQEAEEPEGPEVVMATTGTLGSAFDRVLDELSSTWTIAWMGVEG